MSKYPKINALYKRDMDRTKKEHPLLFGQFAQPEFKYLKDCEWTFTEKIDGTNIRIEYNGEDTSIGFKGRTDKSCIPLHLLDTLHDLFYAFEMQETLGQEFADTIVTLYGEGYGAKINGGSKYFPKKDLLRNEDGRIVGPVNFILFDIKIGNWWLTREICELIAIKLGISIVPIRFKGTLAQAEHLVQETRLQSNFGDFEAEGLVGIPSIGLKARNGGRIITKIKGGDYPQQGPKILKKRITLLKDMDAPGCDIGCVCKDTNNYKGK